MRELSRLAERCEYSRWFMGSEWWDAYVEAFAPDRPHLFVAREERRIVAAVPVRYCEETWLGRSITVLVSMANQWTPRFEVLFERDVQSSLASILGNMVKLSGCSVVYLDRLPCNSVDVQAVAAALAGSGIRHHFDARNASPYKDLPASGAELLAGLNGKFRSNLRNRERRLHRLGKVEFRVTGTRQELLDALEQFFVLERCGWKGAAGGAILGHEDALRFYRLYCADANVNVSIALLKVEDTVVAAHMFLVSSSTLFLLKTTYHEDYGAYSPGQLITQSLMEYAIAHGVGRFDFLGLATNWKLDWGCQLHDNTCLYMFADSFPGSTAYWSRFGVRHQLKKIKPLRALVRRIRSSEPV